MVDILHSATTNRRRLLQGALGALGVPRRLFAEQPPREGSRSYEAAIIVEGAKEYDRASPSALRQHAGEFWELRQAGRPAKRDLWFCVGGRGLAVTQRQRNAKGRA